jgi:YD repeat-containing protein
LATNQVIGDGLEDERVLSFEYDDLGRQVKAVNPLEGYVVTEYDGNGNVTTASTFSASDEFLRKTTCEYDSRNLLVKKVDPNGNEYTYDYDAAGRKIAEHLPIGDIECTYDMYGNLVSVEDQEHATTQMTYDKRNQKDRVIDALGHQTSYTYDGNGNVIAVTDDNGHSVLTRYDAMNRVIEVNKSMVDVLPATLKRADINGDGTVDEEDVEAMGQ